MLARFIGCFLLVILATILTQVGGVVILVSLTIWYNIRARWTFRYPRLALAVLTCLLYLTSTVFLVPTLARINGRRALPVFGEQHLMPRTLLTVFLNRHYVDEELTTLLHDVAYDHAMAHPGTSILYLDACFPFWNGFPLLPHLSHNDGRKVDIAFSYRYADGRVAYWATPSPIGYGALEQPQNDEEDTAKRCMEQGSWWYSILRCVPLDHSLTIDEDRSRELVLRFADHPRTGKVFIEPFLKTRWRIVHDKVRFHGCHAVSHADHIHVQL